MEMTAELFSKFLDFLATQSPKPTVPVVPEPPLRAGVEPVLPLGAPNSIYMPLTGHTLSLPKDEQGELLLSYTMRVSLQAGGGNIGWQQAGAIINAGGLPTGFAATGDPKKDWPLQVDCYYSRLSGSQAYLNDHEKALDNEAKKQFNIRAAQGIA